MSIGKLLIDDQPHQVLPALAKTIGLNEAIFLQQLHYLLNYSKNHIEGKSWIFNTYEQWQEIFCYWSISTIRRTIESVKTRGLLIATDKFNKMKMDKTKWYTIDYDRLANLDISTVKNNNPSVQNEQSDCSKWTDVSVQNEQSNNQKNTQKNTTQDIKKTTQKKSPVLELLAEFGITGQLAEDFITHRKSKNAPITKTALERLQKQADLAGLPLAEVAEVMIERGWRGFKANWDWQETPQNRSKKSKFDDNDDSWWRGKTIEVRGF
ncbi:hypothetical protein UMN179_02364 [Gallibacterium anatis UMN179]|uniref:Alsin helical array domain-containing protein n=1 Tax=Gallibacterium anatis (strain UMN179) TaxID=1005058 RepID=F4H945_GALAU|nr:hypothetical protein [Gallibacterium anatis]AEC18373.1 hypothetical protein UMN179_02364 [Gallibacterium anatis UMN179]